MISIIDYGMGNLGSISNIIRKLGWESEITHSAQAIANSDKIILPGVGSFDQGMDNLQKLGLVEVLRHKVFEKGTPILGICLGMQLFTQSSDEGKSDGLGWIPAKTKRFQINPGSSLKIPHMDWSNISIKRDCALFRNLPEDHRFYFVHSYYVDCDDKSIVAATAVHGIEFCCSIQSKNIFGVQFHPEKSHRFGLLLIKNFLELS